VNGFVDEQLRALLRVPVSASLDGERTSLVAWIDTAFNGGLTIPRQQILELGLSKQSSAEAVLADGRSVELETFACFLDWFGKTRRRRLLPAMGSIHCWERCCSTATAWTSTTRRKRSNSRSGPNDTAREKRELRSSRVPFFAHSWHGPGVRPNGTADRPLFVQICLGGSALLSACSLAVRNRGR
jgi:predicted aspartyl protease